MSEHLTDEQAYAVLVVNALNGLHQAGECCPECCWPCEALRDLSERPGGLNTILARVPKDLDLRDYLWATPDGTVSRAHLAKLWTRTECHHPGGEGGSE